MVQSREIYERNSRSKTFLPQLMRSWDPETSRVDISTGYERCPKVELNLKFSSVLYQHHPRFTGKPGGRSNSRTKAKYTVGHSYVPNTIFECVSFYHTPRIRNNHEDQELPHSAPPCQEGTQSLPQIKDDVIVTERNILNEYDYLIPQNNACNMDGDCNGNGCKMDGGSTANDCTGDGISGGGGYSIGSGCTGNGECAMDGGCTINGSGMTEMNHFYSRDNIHETDTHFIPNHEGFRAFYLRERAKTMMEKSIIQCKGKKVVHFNDNSLNTSRKKTSPSRKKPRENRVFQKPDAMWRLDKEPTELKSPPIQILSYKDNSRKNDYRPPRTSQTICGLPSRGATYYPHPAPSTAWSKYNSTIEEFNSNQEEFIKTVPELPRIVDAFNTRQNIFRPIRARIGPTPGEALFLDSKSSTGGTAESSLKRSPTLPHVSESESRLMAQNLELASSKEENMSITNSDATSDVSTRQNMTPLPPSPNPSRTNQISRMSVDSRDQRL